ncbi:phosphate/phosphonate ABC transporter substrate-binding protein [Thioalkalivibrio denitrificans]|uniref:Phosphate/phosphonate ABC transporter substrate-binding protein n=1 Tax=Thioalkalivibrio denitrificans TaxID=108003 RepID=A0A1V3NSN8_9GAMM|nr:phosphate/phosphite/phosphonate ABC transporter substrate-binding protein [Thioalkalivibrio denitrificans]OOG28139.1 phosphate/phosphonate ABC transporter substrate-binding protein [Thioalkalivibrio denitrificans]
MLAILLALVLVSAPAQAGTSVVADDRDAPLRFGLLPFGSPVFLFNRFVPLTDYLGSQLDRTFALESARDFATHVRRMEAGAYDLVLTAPHFVPIALDSGHYEVLASPRQNLATAYLVAEGDPARDLADLAGIRIATPPPEALITIAGKEYLLSRLPPEAPAPEFISFASHNAAVHAITSGLADAAMASNNMARLEISQNHPVRVLSETDPLPAVGILANRRLPPELRDRITDALIAMADRAEDDNVRAHMAYYPGYKAASAADYERFRSILPETRRQLTPAQDTP